ncbi:MAG: TolB protein [Gaiellales bacterium]|nr:TolB protein [Gaiellales bacterium]
MKRISAAIALAVALAGATAAIATSAPAPSGRVVFMRYRLQNNPLWSELFIADADGSHERKLTHAPNGFEDDHPSWSRHGTTIVFQRCPSRGNGSCAIFATGIGGGGARRLSSHCRPGGGLPSCVDEHAPAYSPDGRRIAFIRFDGVPLAGGVKDGLIMIARPDLRLAKVLVPFATLRSDPDDLAWAPDGKHLAFTVVNDDGAAKPANGRALYTVGADGHGVRRITPWSLRAAGRPSWSPDGRTILFATQPAGTDESLGYGANLYTVRPNGTGLRQLTHNGGYARIFAGAYSPHDGSWIVFSTTEDAVGADRGLPDLFVMRSDGSGIRHLTRSVAWDSAPAWGPLGGIR